MLFLAISIGVFILFYSSAITGPSPARGQESSRPVADAVLFNSAPVLTPEQALHTFELTEGFKIELVASEPLIQDPVAMSFDEKGRIWVLEMQSYMPDTEGNNEEQKASRIVILEDQDGDGKMDHSKIFLDSLVLPRAISIIRGGVLYAEPPNLWFVENLDGQPGKKHLVDSAYTEAGNPEHQANGLMRGIDNWFYNAKSGSRYRYQHPRWIKEETEFRGQWGISMDNYGRLFYNTNSNQLLADLVPPNTLHRNPNFSPSLGINVQVAKNQAVYPIRPTPGINRGYQEEMLDEMQRLRRFTAACGPLIYRGDQFPEEFEGNAFVCEPAGNLIKRNIVDENGPYLEAKQAYQSHEFLASTDERFRPVNLYNAPDGSLYVLDMYRGIIQHKTYLTDYLREQIHSRGLEKPLGWGRIYRVVYEGNWLKSLLKSFKNNSLPALDQATDRELVSYLAHPNGWWRDNAQRLLVERNNQALVTEITELLDPQAYKNYNQVHALWTLEGMGIYDPEIIKLGVQQFSHPKVVATALRIGEQYNTQTEAATVLDIFEQALANKDLMVQLQLALSLGNFMEVDSASVMGMLKAIALEKGEDALIREAIMSSLAGKEKKFLALLKQEPQSPPAMLSFLEETTEKNKIKRQLQEKNFSNAEKEYFLAGKPLYEKICAGCHGKDGEGLFPFAPPLANSEWVTGAKNRLILTVLHGLDGPVTVNGKVYKEPEVQGLMPGFKANPDLTDEKLAALLTYIRNAWNNKAEPIDASKVNSLRKSSMDRKEPYTEEDFKRKNKTMKQKSLGFGIIGTGAIAAHHAKSIQQLDHCHLVAVCSSSAARAAEAAIKFGVPAYDHLDEFLAREDMDVVCICTASGQHLEPTLAAAKAGKHVLTEKPLEVSLERADQMIAACRSHGVKLGCIFQNRFKPDYLKLKEAVEQSSLGKLIMGNAYIKWYREETYYSSSDWKGTLRGDGGAALINQGIHTIDLLLDIMQEVETVYGQVRTAVHKIEGEDLGVSLLNFKNGAIGTIEGGTSLYPGYPERLEIFGAKGSIILEGGQIVQWNIKDGKGMENKSQEHDASGAADPMAVDYKFHMLQINDMVEAIREDREPVVNGESARKSLELILAIYQSSRENKIIQLPI